MNVTEIINLIREYVDEPDEDSTTGDFPDSALIQFINAEHRHLFTTIRSTYEDWFGREYIFPVSDGTLVYTLPREIIHPRRIELIQSGVSQITDSSVSPSYSYYSVDEDDLQAYEVLPQSLLDNQEGVILDYQRNQVVGVEGYTLWDQTIRFGSGLNLGSSQYCRVFYLPTAPDLHQALAASATSTSLTFGSTSATTTIGPIRKVDGYYKGSYVEIISGNGAGEIKRIARHDPTTQTIWIDGTWTTTPNSSSTYSIVSPIVEDFQELLALGATMRAKGIKTEDDTTLVGMMYQNLRGEMVSALEKRNEQRVRRVRKGRY